jgi:Ca2+ transporting ATPase
MGTVDNSPASQFDASVMQLRELMDNRGPEGIAKIQQQFGNVLGICNALRSSPNQGLSGSPKDLDHRREVFGANVIPPKPPKTFLQLVWEALQDVTLIILEVAAIISLALAFYKPPPGEGDDEEGGGNVRLHLDFPNVLCDQ